MNGIFVGVALVAGLLVLFQTMGAKGVGWRAALRRAGAAALMAAAVFLAITGRWLVALPIFVFALGLAGPEAGRHARWMRPILSRWGGLFGSLIGGMASVGASGARGGRATSAAIDLDIDHETGRFDGTVKVGPQAGRRLSALTLDELMALWREIGSDLQSRSLLEAHLDRRHPRWREDAQAGAAAGSGRAAGAGPLTDDEAHEILGLRPGASEAEVREAHRRLMKAVHPDLGGSTFLASQINQAKERLVRKHGVRSDH